MVVDEGIVIRTGLWWKCCGQEVQETRHAECPLICLEGNCRQSLLTGRVINSSKKGQTTIKEMVLMSFWIHYLRTIEVRIRNYYIRCHSWQGTFLFSSTNCWNWRTLSNKMDVLRIILFHYLAPTKTRNCNYYLNATIVFRSTSIDCTYNRLK